MKAQPVDPLLTDVLMPLRQGIDLADRVQAAPSHQGQGRPPAARAAGAERPGGALGCQRKRSISSCSATIWLPLAEEGTTISVFTPAAYQASMPSRTSDGEP